MTPTELRARGFRVFPLLPGSKKPRVSGWTAPGAEYEFAEGDNIGIFTGAYGDGKALLVVDVDNKTDRRGDNTILQLEIEGHEFPNTLTTLTPSGGRHLFYVVDRAVRQGVDVLGPGVDIRSTGGYVVGPGSRLATAGEAGAVGDAYAFAEPDVPLAPAPQWLIDACGQPRERVERPNEVPLTGYAAEVAHAKAVQYLAGEAPASVKGAAGDWTAYKVACRVRDFGVTQAECLELMMDHWFEGSGWSPEKLAVKVGNAYSYALNEAGADNPAVVFEPVDGAVGAVAPPSPMAARYRLESVSEVLARPPPPWLIRGLVPQRGLAMLYGAPGSGKTFLALDMVCAIARGTAWAARRTRPGVAVYVGLEGHIGTRLRAYTKHTGVPAAALADLRIVERQHLSFLADHDAAELARDIKATGIEPALVVIDTLNRSMPGGDENSSLDMGRVIAQSGMLADHLECAVLFVHHSGKNEDAGARGHSSLHGAVDAALAVSRTETGERIVEAAKVKDGEDGEQFAFNLEIVDIGAAADFDPEATPEERLTSCVVTNLHPIARTTKPRKVRLRDAGAIALRAFHETLAFYADDPQRAFEDESVIGDQWRDKFVELCDGEPKAAGAFAKARLELMSKGVVDKLDNGRYALTETGKML